MIQSAARSNVLAPPALPGDFIQEGQQPNLDLDYDVAIVGGGIAGVTLAAALKDSGLRVLIVEAQPQAEAISKGQAYAIHLSSKQIWESIGVWSAIEPQVQRFNRVRMSDADCPHVVEFKPSDLKASALGHVAEHRVLLKELSAFVETCENVAWRCPARVVAQRDCGAYVAVDLQEPGRKPGAIQTLRVRLVVGADGSASQVRERATIKTRGKAYWQSCIVATIQTEKFHQNTAYERFWPSGPFAILPVSDTQCRIVWTAPHAEAQALLALDDAAFTEKLAERFGDRMGRLTLASDRFAFPARLMHSCEYVRSRLALVGDAAHACHPVGGQGLNLGIRDVGALAQVLQEARAKGEDIGSLRVLKRYERWRKWENRLSLGFTDLINLMFSNNIWLLTATRRLGLRAMERVPALKIAALRFMAGLMGRTPALVRKTL
ncbi:FAD-dependent hydroxylase [Altericista sp. CCNU0014]|uniref:FAD-dependent hydroxylase n=1 Tax=Altericista sp. CCNU0014 TaxID=3082949 RepID=UPI00384C3E04